MAAHDLSRLLRPNSIAVVGGGAWCVAIVEQCRKMGFTGDIWPVHPRNETVAGLPAYRDVRALPAAPDACFVGVNRAATIDIVRALSERNAGGAVCFASGFLEAQQEAADGADLQDQLLRAAGDMPILGPNCYGFINYLDGALLWPDQHGGQRAESGVAIITQSSNIAINLTMQRRGLPLAYIVTAGNQAQTGIAAIGQALLADDRVTVLGLHVEGFGDLRALEALASSARRIGKRIVAIKVGKSEQAQSGTVSHTASLAGDDTGAACLLSRLGIARAHDLPSFVEALKLLHMTGPLASNRLASMSCSGGEASLVADAAHGRNLIFPALNQRQRADLRAALGPMVALANPLDYHTYIWGDLAAMTAAFAAMIDPDLAMTLLVVDFPRADRCDPEDWMCTITALAAAKAQTGGNVGLVATLPENLPEVLAARLIASGIVPFAGLQEAIAACEIASFPLRGVAEPLCLPEQSKTAGGVEVIIAEAEAKQRLERYGLRIPCSETASMKNVTGAAARIGFPVVLKGQGIAHKSDVGAVAVNLTGADEVQTAASRMPCETYLVEEMVTGTVAELLIGVIHDPAHGFVMTLGAGGILTELIQDSASFLLPASETDIERALTELRVCRLLDGYRGAQPADKAAVIRAIRSIEAYVVDHADTVEEIEVNPLLCTRDGAIAADALIRCKETRS